MDRRRTPRDRGEAVAQVVLVVPVVLLLLWLGIQAAVCLHAANVAEAAAARGAAAGAARGGGESQARDEARRVVADLDATAAAVPVVELSTATVTVTVSVRVPRVVPFFPTVVERHASEPRERFVGEPDR